MNVLGLIVEYNPFHNGHFYHLEQSVRKTKADITVAVMSGDFLQRGEPALVSKWNRTRMALKGGVDLVVELPYIYAAQKAEIFADGAVSILDQLSVTDICFGSESGEIEDFIQAVEWEELNKNKLDIEIQKQLKSGKSYPRAFSDAFKAVKNSETILDLKQPNNILGFHYIKSIINNHSSIRMHTIKRTGAHYHDQDISHSRIASATALRKELLLNRASPREISEFIPPGTLEELTEYSADNRSLHSWDNYYSFLQHKIMSDTEDELREIYECEEGLEYRLKKCIVHSSSFEDFLSRLKTKRYTRTRLQRLLVHIYLNSTKNFMKQPLSQPFPPYVRVLGMSQKGRSLLSHIKKTLSVPLITKASQSEDPVLKKDILASRLHGMVHHSSRNSFMDEYKAVPVQYDRDLDKFFT
ncbi:nucleotidyltransferase [Salipaludibacillus aurantiacus]|uniref:tRNA(Met) cytidine acetate ligase n=1 Tax=Salipaludibacillus aurantiacus TaxID=1601833 RepID=A0A1H9X156_9BACI|nr:nucleotidyltransferase [Salipaludibacillus aurantiacus]SES39819.1 Predicted nucleotidyltransferase [Salipaludibacillus aurantiacus]